jgi:RNA polymerase sigma-70 factor (ECF subfamily)
MGTMPKQVKPISTDRARWLAAHVVPHEAALRAWLRGKTGLAFDIDDIVQETYAILAAKASVEGIANPKTYAFQVAYSVILQQLRQSRVVPIAAVADVGALEAEIDDPSPEQTMLARDELQRVRRAIEALPRQTRTAFVLRRVEGLSQAEIARRMSLSEHTVEKHIARGIKSLLAQFGSERNAAAAAGGNKAVQASKEKTGPIERDDDDAQTNRKIH